MQTKPDLWRRLLAGSALVIVFMAMASIISPKAGNASPKNDNKSTFTDVIFPSGDTSTAYIGELIGTDYRIRIYPDYPEPTYTIFSLDGELLAQNISRQDAVLQFPTIPIGMFGISAEHHSKTENEIGTHVEIDNLGLAYPEN